MRGAQCTAFLTFFSFFQPQVVSSLFPKNVRDRLLQVDEGGKSGNGGGGNKMFSSSAPTQRLKTFLGGDTEGANAADAQPIADLVRLVHTKRSILCLCNALWIVLVFTKTYQ